MAKNSQCFSTIFAKTDKKNLYKLKALQLKEIKCIKAMLTTANLSAHPVTRVSENEEHQECFEVKPIGYIKSCFGAKNGIPRQASLSPQSRATLKITKTIFTNPEHSLMGLEEFSYLWVIFVFHKNSSMSHPKAKVHPPRLDGEAVGVFSTRSPHRPNPIGLSLVRLEKVEGCTVHLSGVDLLDGTPVLDVKPYIPSYDAPCVSEFLVFREDIPEVAAHAPVLYEKCNKSQFPTGADTSPDAVNACIKNNNRTIGSEHECHAESGGTVEINPACSSKCDALGPTETHEKPLESVRTALWLKAAPVNALKVQFTCRALEDISKFHGRGEHESECDFCLEFLSEAAEVQRLISEALQNDPRSVYRKKRCTDKLYYFYFDSVHVTSWFDESAAIAEVLRVQPLNMAPTYVQNKASGVIVEKSES